MLFISPTHYEHEKEKVKMFTETAFLIASLTAPQEIGATPQAMLWMLPLAAAIAVVYKATKLPKITAGDFLKETAALFGSIVLFVVATALILNIIAWLISG
jgi:hypothetical protein